MCSKFWEDIPRNRTKRDSGVRQMPDPGHRGRGTWGVEALESQDIEMLVGKGVQTLPACPEITSATNRAIHRGSIKEASAESTGSA